MSRIGQSPVSIPEGVSFSSEGGLVKVKGKKGSLEVWWWWWWTIMMLRP